MALRPGSVNNGAPSGAMITPCGPEPLPSEICSICALLGFSYAGSLRVSVWAGIGVRGAPGWLSWRRAARPVVHWSRCARLAGIASHKAVSVTVMGALRCCRHGCHVKTNVPAGSYLASIDLETGATMVYEPPTKDIGTRRVWSD